MAAASELADSLSNMLNEMRTNSEISFRKLFTISKKIADSIDAELEISRVAGTRLIEQTMDAPALKNILENQPKFRSSNTSYLSWKYDF